MQVQQSYWGNDYWQSDYDTQTNTWELTYSILSDTPGDARQTVEYRFHVLSNEPAKANMGFLMYD